MRKVRYSWLMIPQIRINNQLWRMFISFIEHLNILSSQVFLDFHSFTLRETWCVNYASVLIIHIISGCRTLWCWVSNCCGYPACIALDIAERPYWWENGHASQRPIHSVERVPIIGNPFQWSDHKMPVPLILLLIQNEEECWLIPEKTLIKIMMMKIKEGFDTRLIYCACCPLRFPAAVL